MSDVAPAGRWRPARAGIRNIWEYDDQIFDFADGRLVLRGPTVRASPMLSPCWSPSCSTGSWPPTAWTA